jgi:hypothetical protein
VSRPPSSSSLRRGSEHGPLDEQLKVLAAEPDSCSLTMGTTNLGDDVFLNPWPFVKDLCQLVLKRGVGVAASACTTSPRIIARAVMLPSASP